MILFPLLVLLPVVLGCTNPDSDPCASFMSAQRATASAFCATFTKSVVTATTNLPAWASYCSSKPSAISKECACAFTGGSGGGATTTAKATTTLATVTTTKTSAASSPTQTVGGSCGAAPVDQLVGYAAGTTGGGSGSGITVTSCSALTAAVASGGVIKISGVLTGCGIVDILVSGTSIIGVGANSGLTSGGIRIKKASNVILRNLKMHDPPEGEDLIQLNYATNVWIDHCDLSTEGLTGDKDYYDGLLDVTHASDFITISWTKFHDHWKGSLVGHSDSNSGEDTGKLHVTYHHNYFTNVNSRLPSIRFGTAHVYSSCYENNPTSGVHSRMGAQVLVEQNYFLNTKLAIVTQLDSKVDGFAVERNNIFVNSTTLITATGSFTSAPYSYTMDPASCVCDLVKSKAGTGVVG